MSPIGNHPVFSSSGPYPSVAKKAMDSQSQDFDKAKQKGEEEGPKKSALLDEFHCELYNAIGGNDDRLVNRFNDVIYVISITYNLDVVGGGTLNPSLGFYDLLHTHTSFMPLFGAFLGAQVSSQQHYSVQTNEVISTNKFLEHYPKASPYPKVCGTEIGGSLELTSIISEDSLKNADKNEYGPDYNDISSVSDASYNKLKPPSPQIAQQFGSLTAILDFSLIKSVNGGPNWTLMHFRGPTATSGSNNATQATSGTGTSQGLFNLNRTNKDTVTIAMAPYCRAPQNALAETESAKIEAENKFASCITRNMGESAACWAEKKRLVKAKKNFAEKCTTHYHSRGYRDQTEWICALQSCPSAKPDEPAGRPDLGNVLNINNTNITRQILQQLPVFPQLQ